MSLMSLLRLIEDETGNVFITRYIKDENTNIIHRYLDFLNPDNTDKEWDLVIDYNYPSTEESTSVGTLDEPETIQSEEITDEDDIVNFSEEDNPEVVSASDLKLRIVHNDEVIICKKDGQYIPFDFKASDLGLTGNDEEYEITLESYKEDNTSYLKVTVLGETYDADIDDVNSNTTTTPVEVDLPNNIYVQLYTTEKTVFNYHINTLLGKIQEDILDLAYNTSNITFEVEESDTFNAIAPVLDDENLTREELDELVENWINLKVFKGELIPMIVQKINNSSPNLEVNEDNNYWSRPIKPSDNIDTSDASKNTYEYWRGTAYWRAPFTKLAGEIFVADDTDTGIEYNSIFRRKDVQWDSDLESVLPKIGSVETSEEDPYAIYNAVAMKLKDKRYPELNVEVDVANYYNNKANNYDLYNKVYVKIPSFDGLITASVNKTVKNAHDIGTNKVELGNYSINTKIEQLETELLAEPTIDFDYPYKETYSVQLIDVDNVPLSNQYISINLLSVENESASQTGTVYTLLTDENGVVKITLDYDPGTYRLEVNYGGDTGYESSTFTTDVRVGGEKEISIIHLVAGEGQKKVSKKSYWNKYGHSPKVDNITTVKTVELLQSQSSKGNLIRAIGKAVTKTDKKKYGTKLIDTIFEKKCSRCGSTELYWGYHWAGEKKDTGKFKKTGTVETGSLTGRIICKKCGTSYDVLGKAGNKKLKVVRTTEGTNQTTLNKLQKGNLKFGTYEVLISTKKKKNTGTVMSRDSTPGKNVTGVVKNTVKNKAKNIVAGKTGVAAVKILAKWICTNIKNEDREGYYQAPHKTLSRKKGNSYCKTDLFLHMCDAVGVIHDNGISCYYVYSHKKKSKSKKKVKRKTKNKTTKHVFARVNGHWVDVTLKKNPWGHYKSGFGDLKNADIYRYPKLPDGPRKYN